MELSDEQQLAFDKYILGENIFITGPGGSGKSGFGEVFNIPGNEYTYEQGKALCKAYGAKLASYTQIEDAYKGGA
jgi:hypothetical protein